MIRNSNEFMHMISFNESKSDLENEEELLNCCHYTNFQPLLAEDNLEKYNKWSEADEVFWKENICGKEYLPLYIPV